jgi:hypothetical protein
MKQGFTVFFETVRMLAHRDFLGHTGRKNRVPEEFGLWRNVTKDAARGTFSVTSP